MVTGHEVMHKYLPRQLKVWLAQWPAPDKAGYDVMTSWAKQVVNLLPGEVQNVLSHGCHVVAGNDVMHQEIGAKLLKLGKLIIKTDRKCVN